MSNPFVLIGKIIGGDYMIIGILMAIVAGTLVGMQTIFNSKVNERMGSWTTTTLVLGLGFVSSLLFGLIFEGLGLFHFSNMKSWYWFSGLIGVGVVVCLVNGIKILGLTFAISMVMTSQLGFALLWDSLGLFGLEKVAFTYQQLIGVIVIISGIFVFKLGETKEQLNSAVEIERVS
jgi:bacterial/archaeal transporter family-2 protein